MPVKTVHPGEKGVYAFTSSEKMWGGVCGGVVVVVVARGIKQLKGYVKSQRLLFSRSQ